MNDMLEAEEDEAVPLNVTLHAVPEGRPVSVKFIE
jgi:hypothetical protein